MKKIPQAAWFALMASTLAGLTGCSSGPNLAELDNKLEEIRARPRGRIEPPPEFKPIATYSYAAHQLRAPFSPPQDQQVLAVPEGKQVEPDTTRPKEYLEGFSLDSLHMVGTINRPGGQKQALIKDPTGVVTRVAPGDYMGKNFGKVIEVSDTALALVEIVPDGRDGWVERSRNLTIAE